jgi:hypothetical protein
MVLQVIFMKHITEVVPHMRSMRILELMGSKLMF